MYTVFLKFWLILHDIVVYYKKLLLFELELIDKAHRNYFRDHSFISIAPQLFQKIFKMFFFVFLRLLYTNSWLCSITVLKLYTQNFNLLFSKIYNIPFSLHLDQNFFQNDQNAFSKWPKFFSKWPKCIFKMAKIKL